MFEEFITNAHKKRKKSRFRDFNDDEIIRIAELIVFKFTITTTVI